VTRALLLLSSSLGDLFRAITRFTTTFSKNKRGSEDNRRDWGYAGKESPSEFAARRMSCRKRDTDLPFFLRISCVSFSPALRMTRDTHAARWLRGFQRNWFCTIDYSESWNRWKSHLPWLISRWIIPSCHRRQINDNDTTDRCHIREG